MAESLVAQFFRSLTPTTLSVSDFAAKKYRVQPPGSLYWENFDISKTPYLKRPMDLCSYYSPVRQIDFVKAVKIGATVGMIVPVLLYNVLVGRKNQYYVSADQKLLDEYIQVKVRPHFNASGAMEQIGINDRQNDKKKNKKTGESAQLWQFVHGNYLKFCGANNPNNFRQHETDFAVLDERAVFPPFPKEGSAKDLIVGRMEANPNGAMLAVSTPTVAGTDFHRDYMAGTREKWLSPCPLCGAWQEMVFGEMSGENAQGERHLLYGLAFEQKNCQVIGEVRYLCRYCHDYWSEDQKYAVNLKSNWFALKSVYRHLSDSELEEKLNGPATSYFEFYEPPENPRHVSFQIEDTMCNFKRWQNISEGFLEAKQKGRPQDFQSFQNLHRGRFWETQRRRTFRVNNEIPVGEYVLREVPEGVAFLTAWADVQGDRIELGVYGWGVNRENWVIDRIIFRGDPARAPVWAEFERVIMTVRWGDQGLFPAFYGVDEGGHWETMVLEFARRVNYQESRRLGKNVVVVIPTKGSGPNQTKNAPYRPARAKVSSSGKRGGDELLRLIVNTYYYKSLILGDGSVPGWLDGRYNPDSTESIPHGLCHFPQDYKKVWWRQLRSEQQIIEIDSKSGYEKIIWEKTRERNESLDIFVGCTALADYLMETEFMRAFGPHGLTDWDSICQYQIKKRKEGNQA